MTPKNMSANCLSNFSIDACRSICLFSSVWSCHICQDSLLIPETYGILEANDNLFDCHTFITVYSLDIPVVCNDDLNK
jgi:hypothetical protein